MDLEDIGREMKERIGCDKERRTAEPVSCSEVEAAGRVMDVNKEMCLFGDACFNYLMRRQPLFSPTSRPYTIDAVTLAYSHPAERLNLNI